LGTLQFVRDFSIALSNAVYPQYRRHKFVMRRLISLSSIGLDARFPMSVYFSEHAKDQ
jgi:hypothetical protein